MNGKDSYRLDGGEATSSDSPCENGMERSGKSKHYYCDDTNQTSLRQSPDTNNKAVKMEEIIQDNCPPILRQLRDIAVQQLEELPKTSQNGYPDDHVSHISNPSTTTNTRQIQSSSIDDIQNTLPTSSASILQEVSEVNNVNSRPTDLSSASRTSNPEKKQSSKPKKDRSNLRKGKWTVSSYWLTFSHVMIPYFYIANFILPLTLFLPLHDLLHRLKRKSTLPK